MSEETPKECYSEYEGFSRLGSDMDSAVNESPVIAVEESVPAVEMPLRPKKKKKPAPPDPLPLDSRWKPPILTSSLPSPASFHLQETTWDRSIADDQNRIRAIHNQLDTVSCFLDSADVQFLFDNVDEWKDEFPEEYAKLEWARRYIKKKKAALEFEPGIKEGDDMSINPDHVIATDAPDVLSYDPNSAARKNFFNKQQNIEDAIEVQNNGSEKKPGQCRKKNNPSSTKHSRAAQKQIARDQAAEIFSTEPGWTFNQSDFDDEYLKSLDKPRNFNTSTSVSRMYRPSRTPLMRREEILSRTAPFDFSDEALLEGEAETLRVTESITRLMAEEERVSEVKTGTQMGGSKTQMGVERSEYVGRGSWSPIVEVSSVDSSRESLITPDV